MTTVCKECGKPIQSLPFKCHRCGEKFCCEHQLPELHECPFMPVWWHSRGHTRHIIPPGEVKLIFHTLPTYHEEEDLKTPVALTP